VQVASRAVTSETFLAFVASSYGVVMAVSPLLQIRAILRSRDSSSVSAGYQRVLLVGFLLWLGYGIASDNWAIIVPNVVAAIVSLATILVTMRYRPAVG
jgi:MtN3 and saliva related transmembrane protein